MAKRGYWGDIIGSPYLAFGIESENKDLFKKSNGVYTKVCSTGVLILYTVQVSSVMPLKLKGKHEIK